MSAYVLSCPIQSFLDSMRQADIDGRDTPPPPPPPPPNTVFDLHMKTELYPQDWRVSTH